MHKENINILVTLDENYVQYLNVMLSSLLHSNKDCYFDVYLLHSGIRNEVMDKTRDILEGSGRLIMVKADDITLENAPTTARYPREIYYRIFAAKYLPDTLNTILYLDPDIIVNGSITELYRTPMDNYFFAAASHVGIFMRTVNGLRLEMDEESPYINSGVMLMNLKLLRKEQRFEEVFEFIRKRKKQLILPDQDIISGLYGDKILELDTFKYNMTERLFQLHSPLDKKMNVDWVRENSVIIHYCGRNKPWKNNYLGQLDLFYKEAVERMNNSIANRQAVI